LVAIVAAGLVVAGGAAFGVILLVGGGGGGGAGDPTPSDMTAYVGDIEDTDAHIALFAKGDKLSGYVFRVIDPATGAYIDEPITGHDVIYTPTEGLDPGPGQNWDFCTSASFDASPIADGKASLINPPGKKLYGEAGVTGGLATPGVINWLVESARDTNLFGEKVDGEVTLEGISHAFTANLAADDLSAGQAEPGKVCTANDRSSTEAPTSGDTQTPTTTRTQSPPPSPRPEPPPREPLGR
jgi:hypothetical protein